VTVGRLLGCVLELLQRRLMYTLWREGVLADCCACLWCIDTHTKGALLDGC
jgi:hypothetical protein